MAILKAKGTKLQTKVSGTFTDIAYRVNVEPPSPEPQFEKSTHLDSDYVEKVPVIVDLGKVSMTAFFDPNTTLTNTLRGEALTPPTAAREFKVIYPDGLTTPASDTFSGYIAKFEPTGIERDKLLQFKLEIECTDAMAFTAGTP